MIAFLKLSSFAVTLGSLSIILCHKDGGNGEEVFGELLGGILRHRASTVHHKFRVCVFEDALKELISKSAQSVLVGNHNL